MVAVLVLLLIGCSQQERSKQPPTVAVQKGSPSTNVPETIVVRASVSASAQATQAPTPIPEPIATRLPPTRTPLPTSPQQSAGADVLNRLTALETLTATQQELLSTLESKLSALDSRLTALEAHVSSTTPSSDPCRVARPEGYPPFPNILSDFWDKRNYCLIENSSVVSDVIEFSFFGTMQGFHEHGSPYDLYGHQHDDGEHRHEARVRDPYGSSLYKYDTFKATNPSRTAWHAILDVPVPGLHPTLWVREYSPQTDEWITVVSGAGTSSLDTFAQIEWTPVSGRIYSVTATLARGFTESSFTLIYDFESSGSPQDTQPHMMPSNVVPSRLEAMLGAMEHNRLGDGKDVGEE